MVEKSQHEIMVEEYYQSLREEAKMELENNSQLISNFVSMCNNKGIELTSDHISYIQSIGIVADYPNLALRLLNPELDKDGLVSLKYLRDNFETTHISFGYMKADDFMLFPTHYLRRQFSKYANFAPRFCEIFLKFRDNKIDSYIKLDNNRVRVNVDNCFYMECDTWYGAKFNSEIANISDGVVKLCPTLGLPETIISMFFAEVYSLDIKWATKDNIKTFIAEEIKVDSVFEEIDGVKYHPARYIHSEYDLAKGCFRHFDGAIYLYTEEEYQQRKDLDLNFNTKSAKLIKPKSEKLFKMNGEISLDNWILFISHFLTGNPLVFEYFEGEYPEEIKRIVDLYTNQITDSI